MAIRKFTEASSRKSTLSAKSETEPMAPADPEPPAESRTDGEM